MRVYAASFQVKLIECLPRTPPPRLLLDNVSLGRKGSEQRHTRDAERGGIVQQNAHPPDSFRCHRNKVAPLLRMIFFFPSTRKRVHSTWLLRG